MNSEEFIIWLKEYVEDSSEPCHRILESIKQMLDDVNVTNNTIGCVSTSNTGDTTIATTLYDYDQLGMLNDKSLLHRPIALTLTHVIS